MAPFTARHPDRVDRSMTREASRAVASVLSGALPTAARCAERANVC